MDNKGYKFVEDTLESPFWSFRWEFSVRLDNCLINMFPKEDVTITLKDVIDTPDKQFLKQPNFGIVSLRELRQIIGNKPEEKEYILPNENASA